MQTINDWSEIIDNLSQFTQIVKREKTNTYNRFSTFYHWYYFPNEDAFAPSKFIGYKRTTIKNYTGLGSGGETQIALSDYFYKLSKDDSLFKDLYHKLSQFALSLDKKINKKTLSGTGGIYFPKDEYLQIIIEDSQQFLYVSKNDIEAYENEESLSGLEGEKTERLINIYERDPNLRAEAIQIHGTICKVCDFDFERKYGQHGKEFIEVHHLKPLSSLIGSSLINPSTDMTVVCANCHRMIHRNIKHPLTIEELKILLR